MELKLKQLNTFFLRRQFLARERHNLHDDFCLIDPPVISFDGEFLLNAPLYGSDKFKDEINKYFSALYQTGPTTPKWPRRGMGGCMASHLFSRGVSKQKLLKRCRCQQGQFVTVLVMFTVLF